MAGIPSMHQKALQVENPVNKSMAMLNASAQTMQGYDKASKTTQKVNTSILSDVQGWVGVLSSVTSIAGGMGL